MGLFLPIRPEKDKPTIADPDNNPHVLLRDARPSLNPDMGWEINLGGTKEEKLVETFVINDKIHIFFNSSSIDLDMQNSSGKNIGFATMSAGGKIEKHLFYGEPGDSLFKVTYSDNGYILAINNADDTKVSAIIIDFDGNIINSETFSNPLNQKIVDLQIYDYNGTSHFFLVLATENTLLTRTDLKVLVLNQELKAVNETQLNYSLNLKYMTMLPYREIEGAYMLVSNVNNSTTKCLSVATFKLGGKPSYHLYNKNEMDVNYEYVASDFMPIKNGYIAMIIETSGKANILKIDRDLKVNSTIYLALTNATKGKMMYSNSKYYCFINHSYNMSSMKIADTDLIISETLALFNSFTDISDHLIKEQNTLFIGQIGISSILVGLNGNETLLKKTFGNAKSVNSKIKLTSGGYLSICENTEKSGDVGGNFGGSDIWVSFLPF